jgi:hypothetical protein
MQCQYQRQHKHPRLTRQCQLSPACVTQGLMSALPGTFDDTASFKPITHAKIYAYRHARVAADGGRHVLSARVPWMESPVRKRSPRWLNALRRSVSHGLTTRNRRHGRDFRRI